MYLTDTAVNTITITASDLRDGDIIRTHAFPPVEVRRVILRDEYGVTYQGCILETSADGTITRQGIPECLRVGNLGTLTVERATS